MGLNRREFLQGAIAAATAAGLPITGAVALADVVSPNGVSATGIPSGPVMYDPSFDVKTIAELRAYIESLLVFRPYYRRVYDNDDVPMLGFVLAKEGSVAAVRQWVGDVFALGWNEAQEAVEDGLYDESRMIEKCCRCLAIAMPHWVDKGGLRGHPAVWRHVITHRTEGSLVDGGIKHIISFRIAVKA